MAWTDYSTTHSNDWSTEIGEENTDDRIMISTASLYFSGAQLGTSEVFSINELRESYNIPGFDDGYAPVVPDPIFNNIDEGGGGGSTRPSSGFLYPRGQG